MIKKRLHAHSRGFTIIELMIATSAFSLLLMAMLSAFVFLGRLYYKGISEANTQEVARSVLSRTSDVVRLSGSSIANAPASFGWDGAHCIGNKKYSYKINKQLTSNVEDDTLQSDQVLIESDDPGCSNTRSSDPRPGDNPNELLEELMGLAEFNILEQNNLVDVDITITLGDNDQFTRDDQGKAIGCQSDMAGSEFCAVSELDTVVFRKVN